MTLTQIPDVLHLIAPHLNTYDLVACVRVNTLWNSVFIAHLWRTVDDSQRPWRRILTQFKDPVPTFYHPYIQIAEQVERVPEKLLDLFVKYGHHIRRLIIRRPHTVEVCLRARSIAQRVRSQQIKGQAGEQSASTSSPSDDVTTPSPLSEGCDTTILPCEGITVLRFGFLDPVLTFLKRLDRQDLSETPYLTALSATLRRNQQELEQHLVEVHPSLFYQEHDAQDDKLHVVTLARSCWQLVLNNPQLQELDMGPYGTHEDSFMVPGGFLQTTLASCQRLRSVRIGLEKTTDFLVRLPNTLPNLKLLWYYDKSPAGFDALVDTVAKTHELRAESTEREITGGMTSDRDWSDRMPDLRLLDIVAPTQPRHLKAIFTSFPALAMLSLGTLIPDDKTKTSTTNNVHRNGASPLLPAQGLATTLQELYIAGWHCPPTALSSINTRFNSVTRLHLQLISGYRTLLDLLRTFPTLQELQLRKVHNLTEETEVNYSLEPPFPTLKSIHLSKEAFSTADSLNGLLSILPNLTEARLYTVYYGTLPIIVERCPQIEILEFSHKYQEISRLSLLLTSCTKLRSCGGPGLQIPYTDILDKLWVCKDLQKLDCAITGMPYLTQAEQASIMYIRDRWSQNINFPPTFDMSDSAKWDLSFMNEDSWDMWHNKEKFAYRKYSQLVGVLRLIFKHITEYTDLDTVQQDGAIISPSTHTLWTSSKRGRPISSMGRSLKANSRVLSENQARWIHLPS
ncbi:hypothetical protein BGZ96_010644 [Linnemannia gamsii]|uniref:F-box domain-containing protein n=1 Tax=Linnemannia gamsii TaxID=64522 RepID=A0ABQ7JTX5_9FUNG|nr:hypothetical protein BGZ96_010644 [Linnemannia gamsii]